MICFSYIQMGKGEVTILSVPPNTLYESMNQNER